MGRVDVDEMVREMGEEQFAERMAADKLDSVGNQHMLAEIASLLDQLKLIVSAATGGDISTGIRTAEEFQNRLPLSPSKESAEDVTHKIEKAYG